MFDIKTITPEKVKIDTKLHLINQLYNMFEIIENSNISNILNNKDAYAKQIYNSLCYIDEDLKVITGISPG